MSVFIKRKLNSALAYFSKSSWILYFLLSLTVLSWFKPNSIITGGDFGWPIFFSNFLNRVFYLWDSSVNFGYFSARQISSIYPYALWGYFLEIVGFNIQQIQFIIFYISFAFSGLGMYLLSSKLEMNEVGSFVSGVLYMFSPFALIVAWVPSYGITFPFYCFLPLSLYFFINFLTETDNTKRIFSIVAIFLSFFGVSYSNPAYFIIYLGLIIFIFVYLSIFVRAYVSLGSRFLLFISIYLLLNSFWIVPFWLDLSHQYISSNNTIAGLINDHKNFKLNSVLLYDAFRMMGLWSVKAGQFTDYYYDWHNLINTGGFIFVSFIISYLTLFSLLLNKNKNRFVLMMGALLCIGILLNSGAIHDNFLNIIVSGIFKSPLLERAFRSVYIKFGVLLVLPIVFLTSHSLSTLLSSIKTTSIKIVSLVFLLVIYFYFLGKPFINGQIIKSDGIILPGYNVEVPHSYFTFKNVSNSLKLDAKYLSLPLPKSYNLLLKWGSGGYNGADFLSSFLTKPLIYAYDDSQIVKLLINAVNGKKGDVLQHIMSMSNINYIFMHNDINDYAKNDYLTNVKIPKINSHYMMSDKLFNISTLNDGFLPHFYTPQLLIFSSKNTINTLDVLRSATIYDKKNKKVEMVSTPIIEFKKINPTKYRVAIHKAEGKFPLVFSESFHEEWKSYLVPSRLDLPRAGGDLKNYKILDENREDQASGTEVQNFIDKGWISTIGDGKEKEIKHMKWGGNKEVHDYTEKYNIDFISKNFQDTIQNDNLPNGPIFETWFKKPIEDNKNHVMVNGYANSWMMDTEKMCGNDPSTGSGQALCIKNTDGSYDFEIVVEFVPQRFFYIGLAISGATLFGCLLYLLYSRIRKDV